MIRCSDFVRHWSRAFCSHAARAIVADLSHARGKPRSLEGIDETRPDSEDLVRKWKTLTRSLSLSLA